MFSHDSYNLFKKSEEEESDEEEGYYSYDYFERNKGIIKHNQEINKDIKMNELFEYEENNSALKKTKSSKLNKWFIKVSK